MLILKIKIKSESASFTKTEYLKDDYVVSKTNMDLQHLVEKAIKESGMEEPDEVKLTCSFEW